MQEPEQNPIGRPRLAEGEHKGSFNVRIDEQLLVRMQVICFRRTVLGKTPYSQGDFLSDAIRAVKIPREPTRQEVAEFAVKYPAGRDSGDDTIYSKNGKKLFNCMIGPDDNARLKAICYRRSVIRGRPVSEGSLFSGLVIRAEMPPRPTAEQIAAYLAIRPTAKEKVRRMPALSPKPLSRKRA